MYAELGASDHAESRCAAPKRATRRRDPEGTLRYRTFGTAEPETRSLVSYPSTTRKSERGMGLVVEPLTVLPQLAVPSSSK